jgi:hypothetical protein
MARRRGAKIFRHPYILRFERNSHLIEIYEFSKATAIRQFELPAFVNRIEADRFSNAVH